jgi:O-antigen ligase
MATASAATIHAPARSNVSTIWTPICMVLVVGYLGLTRSFAYLGLPGAGVYIGEIALFAFLILHQRESIDRWINSLLISSPLGPTAWAFLAFLCYGIVLVLRGLAQDFQLLTALQGFAFHFYPFYLFLGLWVARRDREFLQRCIRAIAWFNGLYGLAYLVLLHRIGITIPGTEVPLFGQPAGSVVAMLGLLCFEKSPRRAAVPMLLNAAVLLGVQVRAEWLGLIVGLVAWGVVTRRIRQVIAGFAAVVVLLGLGVVFDVRIPAPESRGGEISTRAIIGRALAPVNPNLASRYTTDVESQAGTVKWRTNWWNAIWDSVYETRGQSLFGHGYGFELADLVPGLGIEDIRTPHNVFFYALGYGGWAGVIIFGAFIAALFQLLLKAYRRSRNPFGLIYLLAAVAGAFFGNFFEAPFGAIPFYLLVGLAAAPAFQAARQRTADPPIALDRWRVAGIS